AQLPTACNSGTQTAESCAGACIFCNFNGFVGSTIGGAADEDSTVFCGTIENAQWLGFIAGATTATFTATPIYCNDSNGVQIALYADCQAAPLECNIGKLYGGTTPVSVTTTNLNPGSNYYLLVDGYGGDLCTFSVAVTPVEAVYEPPLGVVGDITGPIRGCPGAVFTYSVLPVAGAGGYIWDGPPGTLVNGDTVPIFVAGAPGSQVQITLGDQSGNICVQAANSCHRNPPCTGSLAVEILGDEYRPKIVLDSVQELHCDQAPTVLETSLTAVGGSYSVVWSTGDGHIVQNANNLKVKVDSVGTYNILVTDLVNGCTSADSVRVAPPAIPNGAALRNKAIRCYGENNGSLRIDSVAGGTPPYLYSLDGQPLGITSGFDYLTPGAHTLLIQTAKGCEWDTTLTIEEPGELLVDLGSDTTMHLGDVLHLWSSTDVNDPSRNHQMLVQSPDLYPYLCDTCTFLPLHSFRYHVTVLDSNGCQATDDREVIVNKERYVYVPNVFAPDANNGNEHFTVFGGEDVVEVRFLRVYTRWGRRIFEALDFVPNDTAIAWDGTENGKKLSPAVFLYETEILFKDGETALYRGDVTLYR
ncbi:MAG: gliding motility-associated C-terminal domain-containing protein, partial [Saprospiraceae bacterium]